MFIRECIKLQIFESIQIHDYINLLIDNNRKVYDLNESELLFKNNSPLSLVVNVDKAIPLGLIITEMITNSVKYATPDSSNIKTISVSIEELDNDYLSIEYKDNGPGLPADFNINSTSTLGIQLISALTEQLDGKLTYQNDNGALFQFTFRN